MKLNFLTYSDDNFKPMQGRLVEHARNIGAFDEIITKGRQELIKTPFYNSPINKNILDRAVYAGCCLWKPYYIVKTLEKMAVNDVLLYIDSGDWIMNGDKLRETVLNIMADKDILLTDGAYKNSDWTKRDTFVTMNCDSVKYHNALQIEAGIIVVKNTLSTIKIMSEWLLWCSIPKVVTHDDNVCDLPNIKGFQDHRADQSVLSILKCRDSLNSSNEMRQFIHCNVNTPNI